MKKKYGLNLLAVFSVLSVGLVTLLGSVSAAPDFLDPAFKSTWERVDRNLDTLSNAGRGYIWGPISLYNGTEPYNGGSRKVQYFDKARMEINNPNGDRTSLFYVTTGLLVKELVTGVQQDGDNIYTQKNPSQIQVVGDPNDTSPNSIAPTYASFASLVSFFNLIPSPSRPGEIVNQAIDRNGILSTINPPDTVRIADYDSVTQQNIADVFVNYFKLNGPIWTGTTYINGAVFFGNPLYVFGRPITDPYWTKALVNNVVKDVLVQLFERRVLTYTPSNSPKDRVEMGNVGQHYYKWRYIQGGGPASTPTPTSTPIGGPAATPTPTPTTIPGSGITNFSQFRAPYLRSGGIPQGMQSFNVQSYKLNSSFTESSPAIDFANNLAIFGADNQVAAIRLSDPPTLAWSFTASAANFSATPSLSNGVVYIGTTTGRVFALNSADGTQRWASSQSGARVQGAPLTDGTNVYYGARDNRLYAVRASDGSSIWQSSTLAGDIESGPIFGSDGTIYVATGQGAAYVYAFNSGGAVLWNSPQLDGAVVNSPAFANNSIYVGTTNGTLYALNTNGSVRTSRTFNAGRGVLTSPAIVNGRVYIGSDDTSVYGVDVNNFNSTLFQYTTAGAVRSSLAVVDGFVYFGSDDRQVYRVEANNSSNAAKLLNSAANQPFGLNSPVVANSKVYIANLDGTFYVIK